VRDVKLAVMRGQTVREEDRELLIGELLGSLYDQGQYKMSDCLWLQDWMFRDLEVRYYRQNLEKLACLQRAVRVFHLRFEFRRVVRSVRVVQRCFRRRCLRKKLMAMTRLSVLVRRISWRTFKSSVLARERSNRRTSGKELQSSGTVIEKLYSRISKLEHRNQELQVVIQNQQRELSRLKSSKGDLVGDLKKRHHSIPTKAIREEQDVRIALEVERRKLQKIFALASNHPDFNRKLQKLLEEPS